MDTADIASLLHAFQRSLSLLADEHRQDASVPFESPAHTCLLPPPPRSTDPRPRPPTPPPSRRPHNHTSYSKRSVPKERPETAKRDSARMWHGGRREEGKGRFITPDSDEEGEGEWKIYPTDTARRTSGPLRSILRNKHAGTTPYQKLPARRVVRWAAVP